MTHKELQEKAREFLATILDGKNADSPAHVVQSAVAIALFVGDPDK